MFLDIKYACYFELVLSISDDVHYESGEGLWLQGEATLQTHSFRDADPQPVILHNSKMIMEYLPSSWDQAWISA